MAAALDLEQIKTFVAIVETGSFTKAAARVHRTQSAVSMQMRRLEERLGKPIFEKIGRQSKLTEDGERLLQYARRLVRLNEETLSVFDGSEVNGHVRIGTPDDYADRFLPEIFARFSRSYPHAEVSVICAPTPNLRQALQEDKLDLAIVTHVPHQMPLGQEIIRREPLLWVASCKHSIEEEEVLPLALGRASCDWRAVALSELEGQGRDYKVSYTSWNSTAVGAAVLAGLAVSVLPESAVRSGMRILTETEGFPRLPHCEIALLRNERTAGKTTKAFAEHIISSLDDTCLSLALDEDGLKNEFGSFVQ
ncbi:LysR substrate-binding domain-containing protein [Flexibacterium corallicola]|uniref:LysR substrate-binding domain-containing protein n=1 Tax=Flexibacterium corallicola TaxID=3037259 RepID=UPI00286F44A9|nr:LysR substrate-binding domain-containing protein [Pseudovibrio sp. M1P-2-3]